jgi:hypothetical protein
MNYPVKNFASKAAGKAILIAAVSAFLTIAVVSCNNASKPENQTGKKHVVESRVIHPAWAEKIGRAHV